MKNKSFDLEEGHFSLTSCADITEICNPLFSHTDINYFAFSRYFRDGRSLILATNPIVLNNLNDICTAGVDKTGVFASEGMSLQPDISGTLMPESTFGFISQNLALDHHGYIFEKHDDYDEQFCFATSPSNKGVNDFYIYYKDALEKFVLYFKDRADKLIKTAAKNKIIIPTPDKSLLRTHSKFDVEALLRDIEHNRYSLLNGKRQCFLTKQEVRVLSSLSKGKTVKQAANGMGLSPRTIELYMKNAKEKLNCYSRSQAIDVFLKSKLSRVV